MSGRANKLRLAIFTEIFLPKIDGIVTVITILLNNLRRVGAEAIVFAPGPHPESYADYPVISIPGVNFPLYPGITLAVPGNRTFETLRDFNPNIIHAMNPVLTGLRGMHFGHKLKVPVVFSFQAHLMEMAKFYGFGFMQEPMWALHRHFYRQADYRLAPSRRVAAELVSRGFGSVGLWRRGVNIEAFSPDFYNSEMRNELSGGNPDKVLLLSVGRLAPEKQVEQLLPVLDAIPEAHLAIVGDGPYRQKLEEIFRGRSVTFTGYKKGVELSKAYASADIFMFPSSTIETFGLVAAEAMASGVPTISSNVGGVPELIEQGVNGYIFEPGDINQMITYVRELVENGDKRKKMGQAARESMCKLSWEEVMNELFDTYDSIIQNYKLR